MNLTNTVTVKPGDVVYVCGLAFGIIACVAALHGIKVVGVIALIWSFVLFRLSDLA